MKKITTILFSVFLGFIAHAQTQLVHVKLDRWAKDERFDRMMNPVAFYYTSGDSIFAYDVENLKDPQTLVIKRPSGYKSYAYGYIHFAGVPNNMSNGQMNLLLVNVEQREPFLFVDQNNNLDFTDDGKPIKVPGPWFLKDSALIELNASRPGSGSIAIQLTRMDFAGKYAYKKMLNDYYEFFYKDRKFIGIDYCFREQRYVLRSGIFKTDRDSFLVALMDANNNGRYNDKDTDMIIVGNYGDSVFDAKDELHSFLIKEDKTAQYLERNGEQYAILEVNPAGEYVVFRQADSTDHFDKIAIGKKAPKFNFVDWSGKKYKVKKYRRKEVYIYFTSPKTNQFKNDTMWLRKIADEFGDRMQVIAFIDVNKSYELRIFGTYSNLNWIAAFKDKYTLQKLRLKGIPSSLWLAKKRRVKVYQMNPEQVYQELKRDPSNRSK